MSPAPAWSGKGARPVPAPTVRELGPEFGCFILGAKAALADDNFNPYRSEDCALAGGFEARAAAWGRGHAWATGRKTKCR